MRPTDDRAVAAPRPHESSCASTVAWSPFADVDDADGCADPEARTRAGQLIGNRYRVRSLRGAGGMGEVWIAEDTVVDRAVALKRLRPQTTAEFGDQSLLDEARSAARASHPNVVTVHDVVEDRDQTWLVMEELAGPSLADILDERGRLSADEVVALGVQLLSALQAVHQAGLVHRDVKPANVHVCGGRRVVLTDFGLAGPAGRTASGIVAGSPAYLAPETFLEGRFSPASDLFALGVTLYRALEGRRPFVPSWPLDATTASPPRPMRHPGRVGAVIVDLLEHDPDRRLGAAEALSRLQAMTLVAAMPWAG